MKITRYSCIAIIALVISTLMVNAAPSHFIIPELHEMKVMDGQFILSQDTVIVAPTILKNEVFQLRDTLVPATGLSSPFKTKAKSKSYPNYKNHR